MDASGRDRFAVFLSHNSRDKPLVERVAARLAGEGLAPWLDKWHLRPGEHWQDAIAEALLSSGACAVFLGPHGLGDWAREELALAIDRAVKDPSFRVFLVLLPGVDPLDEGAVSPFLRMRTWVDLRAGPDDPDAWRALTGAISGGGPAPRPPQAGAPGPPAGRLLALPSPPTPLIGREREIGQVCALLRRPGTRIVTLMGPGGVGKTRLAIAVGAAMADDFLGGVAFVPLAAILDASLVMPAVARALGVAGASDRSPLEDVRALLADRPLLLVVDNCEQVVAAAPELAALLSACPGVRLLATSRAALRLAGEHEVDVPGLALPDAGRQAPPDVLGGYEAVALFVERARAVRPDFRLTEATAPAVVEICRRLDSLPLAIELAAARTRLLPPPALLQRLARSLDVLTAGTRDAPGRQRTLRDTIAWSYGLLDAPERTLLRRLGVFVGGWTLETAGAICGDGAPDPLDGMAALADQSMIRQGEAGEGEPRFDMLQTIREFCVERLEAEGEALAVRGRHARYFLAAAESGAAARGDPAWSGWLRWFDEERENLRAALRHLRGAGEVDAYRRLVTALYSFWYARSFFTEAASHYDALAGIVREPTGERAEILGRAAELARLRGEMAAARSLQEEALAIHRARGEDAGIADALRQLGFMAMLEGDISTARAQMEESLAIERARGNRRGQGAVLTWLTALADNQDDFAAAKRFC